MRSHCLEMDTFSLADSLQLDDEHPKTLKEVSSIAQSFIRLSHYDALKSHILSNSHTFNPTRCRAMTKAYAVLATAYSGMRDEQKCREAVACAEVFADGF